MHWGPSVSSRRADCGSSPLSPGLNPIWLNVRFVVEYWHWSRFSVTSVYPPNHNTSIFPTHLSKFIEVCSSSIRQHIVASSALNFGALSLAGCAVQQGFHHTDGFSLSVCVFFCSYFENENRMFISPVVSWLKHEFRLFRICIILGKGDGFATCPSVASYVSAHVYV
jgi:hypothetical protein